MSASGMLPKNETSRMPKNETSRMKGKEDYIDIDNNETDHAYLQNAFTYSPNVETFWQQSVLGSLLLKTKGHKFDLNMPIFA